MRLLATAALAVTALTGCGGDSAVAPELTPANGPQLWQQELLASPVSSLWGPRPDLLYANGGSGFVSRYQNNSWEVVPTVEDATILDLWGSADNDIFGVAGNDVLHYDGSAWTVSYQGTDPLLDIWGDSGSDVWAVGSGGTIVHFDGNAWTKQPSGTDRPLTSIDGSSANNVYVQGNFLGGDYFVLRYNGTSWVRAPMPSADGRATSLSVDPSGIAHAGSSDGWIYRGTNSLADWSFLGVTSNQMVATGGTVFGTDADGRLFEQPARNDTPLWHSLPARVRSLWRAPWDHVYVTGNGGMVTAHVGKAWQLLREALPVVQLNTVFGAADGTSFALGYNGSYVFDGDAWSPQPLANASASAAGWALSSDFAIAVGAGGAINHWTGAGWQNVTSPTSGNLVGVWAASDTDAFAVAFDGTVLHYDGVSWQTTATLPYHLAAIHGSARDDVWAAPSVGGRIMHYDGSSWTDVALPSTTLPTAVWALSPSDVVVVGYEGMAVHFDGNNWTQLPTPSNERLIDVWAQGPGAVFALGEDGNIIRFDGKEWSHYTRTPGAMGLSLWGDGQDLLSAGTVTSVFRLRM